MAKINGTQNPADLQTKALPGEQIRSHCSRINVYFEQDRAESAPALDAIVCQAHRRHRTLEGPEVTRKRDEMLKRAVTIIKRRNEEANFKIMWKDGEVKVDNLVAFQIHQGVGTFVNDWAGTDFSMN